MTELSYRDLSSRVIEAAIAVHKALGPGFLESVYEGALCVELGRRNIRYKRQRVIKIIYEGVEVGEHRLDLLIEGVLMIELKAVKSLEDIFFAIGRSYLKAAGIEDGLIFNFAAMPLTIRRVGREWHAIS